MEKIVLSLNTLGRILVHIYLLNQNCHIRNVLEVQSSDQIMKNRLRLKTSIDTVRFLSLQACTLPR